MTFRFGSRVAGQPKANSNSQRFFFILPLIEFVIGVMIATTLIFFIPRILNGRGGCPHAGWRKCFRISTGATAAAAAASIDSTSAATGAPIAFPYISVPIAQIVIPIRAVVMIPIPIVVGTPRMGRGRRRRTEIGFRFVVGHHRVIVSTVRRVPASFGGVPIAAIDQTRAVPVRGRRGHETSKGSGTHLSRTRRRHEWGHEGRNKGRRHERRRRQSHHGRSIGRFHSDG